MKRKWILLFSLVLVLLAPSAMATDAEYDVPNTVSQHYFHQMVKWEDLEHSIEQQALYAACLLTDAQNALGQAGFDVEEVSDIILYKLAGMVFVDAYQHADCWTFIYAGGDISVQLDKDTVYAEDPVGFVRILVKQGIYEDYAVVTKGDLRRAKEQMQERMALTEKGDAETYFRYADRVYVSRCGFFAFICQQKGGFVSASGQYLSDPSWNSCAAFRQEGYAPVYTGPFSHGYASGGKWGLIDTTGKMVVPMEYDDMPLGPYDGVFSMIREGKRYFYDTAAGSLFTVDGFDYVSSDISEGMVSVFRGTLKQDGRPDKGLWGFADLQGSTIIEPEWDAVSAWSEGFSVVTRAGRQGLLRQDGTLLIPCMFDEVTDVKNGYYVIRTANEYAVMDVNGHEHWRFSGEYRHVDVEDYGYISVYKSFENEGALFRCDGTQVLSGRWYDIKVWDADTARVGEKNADKSKSFGVIDLNTGKMLVPLIWEDIQKGEYEMYLVERNKQFGYLDAHFNEVISARYEDATNFHEAYAAVRQDGQWCIIDATGEVIY